jgi:rSAM/selenodomain-associated transferase 2
VKVALSIVVPVLDEATGITAMLQALEPLRKRGAEVIVVDGGSRDGTPGLAAALADRVVSSARGRARQMNAGAALAGAEVLLFLHADTRLPDAADEHIAAALRGGAGWGRFDVRIDGRPWMLHVVAACMNQRSRLTGIATGDQALFVRRALFQQLGGYPDQPLMEDVELSRRLRRVAPPACLRETVVTSGRRWESRGVWRTIVLMWWLRWRYWRGVSPDRLARAYH